MRIYLDTSAIVSLFVTEDRTEEVTRLVTEWPDPIVISDLAVGEFSAAISTAVRMKRQTEAEGMEALGDFDLWRANGAERFSVAREDMRLATSHVRRFDLALLFPDALHLAACARANAALITGDRRQAVAAQLVGLTVKLL